FASGRCPAAWGRARMAARVRLRMRTPRTQELLPMKARRSSAVLIAVPLALVALTGAGRTCRAAFGPSPLPQNAYVLQLPEVTPGTYVIRGVDPTFGGFTFESSNPVGVDPATDRVVRVPGTEDWGGLTFRPDDPDALIGFATEYPNPLAGSMIFVFTSGGSFPRSFLFPGR